MAKVEFTMKNGRKTIMDHRLARHLAKLGRGTYQTAAISESLANAALSAFPGTNGTRTIYDVDREIKAENAKVAAESVEASDGLDGLGKAELHALAKERGVQVHHAAGADKVRAALREAAQ